MVRERRERRREFEEEKKVWIPRSSIGKKVKEKQIVNIDEIFELGKPILEHEIVDELLPDIEHEVLEVKSTQRMTDCGRKAQFRVIVLVGDKNGHVGVGFGKSEEIRPAIESALKNAKRRIISVPLGCGSWECGCGKKHSVPIKVVGRGGSIEITLKPAPAGLGLAANKIVRKVLLMAGMKDVWSFSRGSTSNIYNMSTATIDALDSLNLMRKGRKEAQK